MITSRNILRGKGIGVAFMALALLAFGPGASAWASVAVPQTPLLGSTVTKYADPMPVFGPAGTTNPRVTATDFDVLYEEFQQKVLPNAFYTGLAGFNLPDGTPIDPTQGTYVWGYKVGGAPHLYPGFTVEATQNTPTIMRYFNTLPDKPIMQQYLTVDQTIHWANPLGLGMMDPLRVTPYGWPSYPGGVPAGAPQPVVTHLHGAEVQSEFDGGPEQWFTKTGLRGPDYRTLARRHAGTPVATNEAVYRYLNGQQATAMWFHDHALGVTRLTFTPVWPPFISSGTPMTPGLPGIRGHLPAGRLTSMNRHSGPAVRHQGPVALPGRSSRRLERTPDESARPSLLEPGVFRGRYCGERRNWPTPGGAPALPFPLS